MVQGAVTVLTTAPQKGSLADAGGRILKWVFIIIAILILVLAIWFVWQLAQYEFSITDYMEGEFNVTDTGDSLGEAWAESILRFSIFGIIGGAAGVGTSSTGWSGVQENIGKGRDSVFTALVRLFGG